MQTVSAENASELLIWVPLGILVCLLVVFIIKQTAQFVAFMGGKIVFWRHVIPILLSSALIVFGRDWLISEYDINLSFNILFCVWIICVLYPLIEWIIRLGIIKGICMFILQVISALLLVCLLYASVLLMATAVALIMGMTIAIEGHAVMVIGIYTGEMVSVVKRNEVYWYDMEGNLYILENNEYLRRQSDNEVFKFT